MLSWRLPEVLLPRPQVMSFPSACWKECVMCLYCADVAVKDGAVSPEAATAAAREGKLLE